MTQPNNKHIIDGLRVAARSRSLGSMSQASLNNLGFQGLADDYAQSHTNQSQQNQHYQPPAPTIPLEIQRQTAPSNTVEFSNLTDRLTRLKTAKQVPAQLTQPAEPRATILTKPELSSKNPPQAKISAQNHTVENALKKTESSSASSSTQSSWKATKVWSATETKALESKNLQKLNRKKNERRKEKKRSQRGFQFVDYSLTILLLIMSIGLGINLTFRNNIKQALAANQPQVAGVSETAPLSTQDFSSSIAPENSITQADFEAWMNQHYPEQNQTAAAQTPANSNTPTPTTQSPKTDSGILSLFGASDIEELNKMSIDTGSIDQQISNAQKKNQYLALNKRINDYIATYRSYEAYDNQLSTPLTGITYIAVSEQTGMPIKYLMAISRAESRFGTDRFTASGNLTRPGQHLNPCSIGLDDSGGNIGFKSWEEGLMACGKWYQYFQNKGVSDCRKWGIFNPNGDYCSKIETLAGEIDSYLNKPQ